MSDTSATTSRPVAVETAQARILVVDDVEANRESLSRRLARHGYALEVAVDGQATLDRLTRDPPFDLILLDVMMPGVSGLDVLTKVRQTQSPADLPIIMATAKGESEDIVSAMRMGANDYVTKPLDFPVVLARVQTQLALKRSVEQIRRLERDLSERNTVLEQLNEKLRVAAERTQRDLALGARVQASMLPNDLPVISGLEFAWEFRPCDHVAGDALNICPIAPGIVGVYVLDVVGHGVASSLLSVAAMCAIGNGCARDTMLVGPDGLAITPAEVARRLNDAFPFNAETGQFFTFFYAVIDVNAGQLRYVSAGHPGAILLPGDSAASAHSLDRSCTPIGIGGSYEDHVVPFTSGDLLFLYSDGVNEAVRADSERFGTERLIEALDTQRARPIQEVLDALLTELDAWRGGEPSHDDVTLLAIARN